MREFAKRVAIDFAVAAAAVLVIDAEKIISASTREQFGLIAVATARAAAIAGFRAIAPLIVARRNGTR
jgi:nicotinic acid phosphoribosyltransferase